MATVFYDDLIPWEKLMQTLTVISPDAQERLELLEHIEEAIHSEVVIVILHHLPSQHHDDFLEQFGNRPHDTTLRSYLQSHADPLIEAHIREVATKLIEDILVDLANEES